MIKTQKIGNRHIKQILPKEKKPKKWKGQDVFETQYFNMMLLARKFSGKTNFIGNILPMISSKKKTNIIIISGTVNQDDTWKEIVRKLEDEDYRVITFDSIFDENGINVLTDLINMVKKNAAERAGKTAEESEPVDGDIFTDFDPNEEYVIVIDDCSGELRRCDLPAIMKLHRHSKTKIIISSQHYADIRLDARKNLDYYVLWAGLDEDILKSVFNACGLNMKFDKFDEIYKFATKPDREGERSYNFLFVDCARNKFRKNLDTEIKIET